MFIERFPEFGSMRILDLGGTAWFWQSAPQLPAHITLENLDGDADQTGPQVHVVDLACPVRQVRADATSDLDALDGDRFDLVFSNSVIEHLGGYESRLRFARNVMRLADRYWIQTPYRYFPIEPHWLFPGFQFLPLRMRATVSVRWPLGYIHTPNSSDAVKAALETELITVTEMRHLFPDARIVHEAVLGMTKSIIAVRDEPAVPAVG
jgi:hypothetical protein